jgi:hypothetical protein
LEKKKQKTCALWPRGRFTSVAHKQKFFGSFFQKRTSFLRKILRIPSRRLISLSLVRKVPKFLGAAFRTAGFLPELKRAFADPVFGHLIVFGQAFLL